MINTMDDVRENPMNLPKSLLFKTIKEAISTGADQSISDLTEIIYGGLRVQTAQETRLGEVNRYIDTQKQDQQAAIETMKSGFIEMGVKFNELIEQTDRRFNELIHQMDKRFEQVDKRFEQSDKRFDDLIHQFDKRFEQWDRRFDDVIHQLDRRFTFMTWLVGLGFVSINAVVIILKIFS